MNWSTSTKSSTQKKNKKYRQKPQINIKGQTKYIPLIPQDALYRQNLFRLSNVQFQCALQKVLRDLNALLYMNEEDFFQQLQNSDSLRICLQSCLVCLCKNSYYNLCQVKILQQNKEQINFPNNYFIYYDKLNYTVLKIYFRIVHAQKQSHKQIIYNSWLLDIPKMIQFSMIYCVRKDNTYEFAHLEMVKLIISKAISSNLKDYAKDFDDFINILYQDKLPLIHRDIKYLINLSPQAMSKAQNNFSNPLRSFLITANKILFQIKDLFTLICYVYRCFPALLKQKLATDHEVLQDTIRIFIQFVQNTPLWKIAPYERQFKMNFQDIHRTACECFIQNFKILKEVIQRGDSLKNDYYSRAITSYSVHCMYLSSNKINKDYQKIYQRMIKTIMYEFEEQSIFFMREAPSKLNFIKLTQDQKVCIKKSFNIGGKLYNQLQELKQDKQLEMRIKEKIQNFFKKQQKLKRQDKIMFNQPQSIVRRKQQNKKKIFDKRQVKQVRQKQVQGVDKDRNIMKQNVSQLDFSVLNENRDSQGQYEQDMDLSFSVLKESNQESEKQNKLIQTYQKLSRIKYNRIQLQNSLKSIKYNVLNSAKKFTQKLIVRTQSMNQKQNTKTKLLEKMEDKVLNYQNELKIHKDSKDQLLDCLYDIQFPEVGMQTYQPASSTSAFKNELQKSYSKSVNDSILAMDNKKGNQQFKLFSQFLIKNFI